MSSGYIADSFSGSDAVRKAGLRQGIECRSWDIKHGPTGDLLRRDVLLSIISDIKSGKILGIALAPPCASWSQARNRSKVIRSRQYPWGIPLQDLTDSELASLLHGNKT